MRRRSHGLYASPTAIFLAFILLFLTCVSVPFAQDIRLFTLVDRHTGGSIRFGLWGYCLPTDVHGYPPCTMPELGWTFNNIPTLTGLEDTISPRLTGSLLVHLIVTFAVFLIFVLTTVFVTKRSLQRKFDASLRRRSSLSLVVTVCTLAAAVLASTAFVIDLVVIGKVKAHVSRATGTAKNMKAYTGAIAWLSLVAAVILWSSTIMLYLLSKERSNSRISTGDSGTIYDSDASSRREESVPRSVGSSYSREPSDYSVRSRTASVYNSPGEDEGRPVASRDTYSRRSKSLDEYESDRSRRNKRGFLASLCPCLRRNKGGDRDPSEEDIELATVGSSHSSRATAEYRPSSEDLRRRKSRSVTAVEYTDRSGVSEEEYGSIADDASRYSEPGSAMYVADNHGSEQSRSKTLSTSYASEHSDGGFTDEDSEITRVSSPTSTIDDSTLKSSSAPVAEINSNDEGMTQTTSMSAYSRGSRSLGPENERGEESYVSDSGQGSLDDIGSEGSGVDYVSQRTASSPNDLQSGVPYTTEQERSQATEDHSGTLGYDNSLTRTPLESGSEMSYVGTEDDANSVLSQQTPTYETSEAENLSDNEMDGRGSESTLLTEAVLNTERSRDVSNSLEGEVEELHKTNIVTEPGRGDSSYISDQGSPLISGSERNEPLASQISPSPARSETDVGSNVASESRYSDMPSSVVGLSEEQQLSHTSVTDPESGNEVSREVSVVPPSSSDEGEDSVGPSQESPFESEIQSELLPTSGSLDDVDERVSESSRHSPMPSGSDGDEVNSDSASPSRVSQDSDGYSICGIVSTSDHASDIRSQYGTIYDDTPSFQSQSITPNTKSDTAINEQYSGSPSRSYPTTQYDDRFSPGDVSRADSDQDGMTRDYSLQPPSSLYPEQDRYSGDYITVPRSPSYSNRDGLSTVPDDRFDSGGTPALYSSRDRVTGGYTSPPASSPRRDQDNRDYTTVPRSPSSSDRDRGSSGYTPPPPSSYPDQDSGGYTTVPRSPSYSIRDSLSTVPDDKFSSGRRSPLHAGQDTVTRDYTSQSATPSHPDQDSGGYTDVPRSPSYSGRDSPTTPPDDKFDSGRTPPHYSSQDRATGSYTSPPASSPYPDRDSGDYTGVPCLPSYSGRGSFTASPDDKFDSIETSPLRSGQDRVTGGCTSQPASPSHPDQDSGGYTSVPRSPSYSDRESPTSPLDDKSGPGGTSPLYSSQDRATGYTSQPATPPHPSQENGGYTTVPHSPSYSNRDGLTTPPDDEFDSAGTPPLYSSRDRVTGHTRTPAFSPYPDQDSGGYTSYPGQDSLTTSPDDKFDSRETSPLHSSEDRVTGYTPPPASQSHADQDSGDYTTVPCSPSYSNRDGLTTPSGDKFNSGRTSPLYFNQDRVTSDYTPRSASPYHSDQDSRGYTTVPRSSSYSNRDGLTIPPDDKFGSGRTSPLNSNQDRVTSGYTSRPASSPYPDQDSEGYTTVPRSPSYSNRDSLATSPDDRFSSGGTLPGGYTSSSAPASHPDQDSEGYTTVPGSPSYSNRDSFVTPPDDKFSSRGTSPLRSSQDRVASGYTPPPASSPYPNPNSASYTSAPRSPSYSGRNGLTTSPDDKFDSRGTSPLHSTQDRVTGGYTSQPASLPYSDQDGDGYTIATRSPSYSNRDSVTSPSGDKFDSIRTSPLYSNRDRVTGGYTSPPASSPHPGQGTYTRGYTTAPYSPSYSGRGRLTTSPDDKFDSGGTSPLHSSQDRVTGYTSPPASPSHPDQDNGGYTTVPRSSSYSNRDSLTTPSDDKFNSGGASPLHSSRDRVIGGYSSPPESSPYPEQDRYSRNYTNVPRSLSYSGRDSLTTPSGGKFDSGRTSPLYSNQDRVTGGYTSPQASPPYPDQDSGRHTIVPGSTPYSNRDSFTAPSGDRFDSGGASPVYSSQDRATGGYTPPPASSPYPGQDRYSGGYTTVPGSYSAHDRLTGRYTTPPNDKYDSGRTSPLYSSQYRVTDYTPPPASQSHADEDSGGYTTIPRSPSYSDRHSLVTPSGDKVGRTSPFYSNQGRVTGGYSSPPASSPYPEQDRYSRNYTNAPDSLSYSGRDRLATPPDDRFDSGGMSPLYSSQDRVTGYTPPPASSPYPGQDRYSGGYTTVPGSRSYSDRDRLTGRYTTPPNDKYDSGGISPVYSNHDGVTNGYTSPPASPPYSNQDRHYRSYTTVPGSPPYTDQAGSNASPPYYRDAYTRDYNTVPGSPPYSNQDRFSGDYISGSPALSSTGSDPADGFHSGSSAPYDIAASRRRTNSFVSGVRTPSGYRTDSAPPVEPMGRRNTDSSLPGQRYSSAPPTSDPGYENYYNSDTNTNRRISGDTIPERRGSSGSYYSDEFPGSAPYRTTDRLEGWHSSASPGRSSDEAASKRRSSARDYTYEGNSLPEDFDNDYSQSETPPKSNRSAFGSDSGGSASSPISTVRGSSLGDTVYPEDSLLRDSDDTIPGINDEDVSGRANPESDHVCSWCEDDSPTEGAQSIAVKGSSAEIPEGENIPRICEICGAYIYA